MRMFWCVSEIRLFSLSMVFVCYFSQWFCVLVYWSKPSYVIIAFVNFIIKIKMNM